jgi:DNA-binding MarR family transcriptional regulator
MQDPVVSPWLPIEPCTYIDSLYNPRTMASARLADQLGVVLTRLINVLREAVLPAGMNSAQARTLLSLHDAGPQRVTDLARLDHLKQPTMSAVLIRMERLGWVRRRDDDDDLRAVIVDITEQGEQIALQLIAARTAVLESYLETLSAADRDALKSALPALRKLTGKRPPRG